MKPSGIHLLALYGGIFPRAVGRSIIVVLLVALGVAPSVGRAESTIKLDRELLFATQHEPVIQPRAVISDGKSEFVIAGGINATRQAWAAKVDVAGTIIWEHVVDILPSDQPTFAHQYGIHPGFTGAVSMSDGTTYLCGSMPRPRGYYSPGLLSHIGAKGEVLGEEMILPEQRNALGLVHVDDCVAWGEGIAILGGIEHFARPEDKNTPFAENARRVWIVAINSAGKKVFDVRVESAADQTIRDPGSLLSFSDGSLVVGLTNNLVSDFIRLDSRGGVLAHNSFTHRFLLVRSTGAGAVQIFGATGTNDNPRAISLLTLDRQLQLADQVDGTYAHGFLARVGYRLADGGLALFGSQAREGLFSSGPASGILRMNNHLQAQDYFEPPRSKLDDEHSIWAAAPIENSGEFAIVTSAIAHGLDPNHPEKEGDIPNFRRGVAMDTVTVR